MRLRDLFEMPLAGYYHPPDMGEEQPGKRVWSPMDRKLIQSPKTKDYLVKQLKNVKANWWIAFSNDPALVGRISPYSKDQIRDSSDPFMGRVTYEECVRQVGEQHATYLFHIYNKLDKPAAVFLLTENDDPAEFINVMPMNGRIILHRIMHGAFIRAVEGGSIDSGPTKLAKEIDDAIFDFGCTKAGVALRQQYNSLAKIFRSVGWNYNADFEMGQVIAEMVVALFPLRSIQNAINESEMMIELAVQKTLYGRILPRKDLQVAPAMRFELNQLIALINTNMQRILDTIEGVYI